MNQKTNDTSPILNFLINSSTSSASEVQWKAESDSEAWPLEINKLKSLQKRDYVYMHDNLMINEPNISRYERATIIEKLFMSVDGSDDLKVVYAATSLLDCLFADDIL